MERTRTVFIIVIGLFLAALAAVSLLDEQYLLVSFALVVAALLPFFVRFEWKELQAREIVLIGMLAAIAAVSRVPFSAIPSVQPTTFVIIVSALVFGAETGFLIGALAALVSNMFLGQGPWTPWQMFAWGMAGWSAGLLRHFSWMHKRWGMAAFGFVWGFLFGWIMNVWVAVGLLDSFAWHSLLTIYASSVYFDLAHALSNVFFLVVFGTGWIRILHRYKRKYGLLE